jgi:hypothetical protein
MPAPARPPSRPVLALALLALGATTARADLRFAAPQVDAGEVRTGRPLAHLFPFVNEGPEVVEITDLVPSCGCVTPRLPQRVYRPGEPGSLLLEVHTLSQPAGPHRWTVRVRYRRGAASGEVALEMIARVVTEITVEPAALTIFADSAVRHDIRLTDTRPRPLHITHVHSSAAGLSGRVTSGPPNTSGPVAYTIRLEVAGDFAEGRHEETLTVGTDDPAYADLNVLVTVVKRPRQRLTALPERVTLFCAERLTEVSQLVRLRDRDNGRVVIERVDADSPAVSCRWAPGPDTMGTLKITVDARGLRDGRLDSAVHVHFRGPARETLTIPVEVRSR